ncbi:MAG: M24 family metallopeptidase, partial [Ilumatobacteraceae bacterium]
HARPTTRQFVEGDTVVIDVGALVSGYHSDMTRTFVVGEPTVEQRRWYELVLESQMAGLEAVAAGVRVSDVDRACRSVFESAGLSDLFVHGTGHGVGLDIHEEPFLGASGQTELVAGDVVTVEPGLYRVGTGGVRIEDLVVVTSEGHRNLTTHPKDSPCLPSRRTT